MFSISVWCHQCAEVYIKYAEALEFHHVQVDQTIPFLILFWAGKMLGYDSNSNCWFSLLTSCFERAFMGNMFWNTTMNFLLGQSIIWELWSLGLTVLLESLISITKCRYLFYLFLPPFLAPAFLPLPLLFPLSPFFSKCYKVGHYLKVYNSYPTFEIINCMLSVMENQTYHYNL